jgi:hypothetical protein
MLVFLPEPAQAELHIPLPLTHWEVPLATTVLGQMLFSVISLLGAILGGRLAIFRHRVSIRAGLVLNCLLIVSIAYTLYAARYG